MVNLMQDNQEKSVMKKPQNESSMPEPEDDSIFKGMTAEAKENLLTNLMMDYLKKKAHTLLALWNPYAAFISSCDYCQKY
jgi:hypothetical protein